MRKHEDRFGDRVEATQGDDVALSAFAGDHPIDHYPPDLGLEPIHMDLDLTLDLEGETLRAVVTHTVRSNRPGVRKLVLDAVSFEDVTVEDVTGAPLTFSYDGEKIVALWAAPFAKGDERLLVVRYRVTKPATGLFFMRPTPTAPTKPRYAATDHETERARYWLPCIDLPNVRTTLAFHITAAADLTILANGRLESEVQGKDGTKTAHWCLEQRCPSYLVSFVVGDLVRSDHAGFGPIPVASFATADYTPEDLERTFGQTGAMLAWMTHRLGVPYPYPKYYQFALPAFSGAMENISLVSWNDRFVCTADNKDELGWLTDQVNVHEMAHAFFGDLVGCRDFAHAWLKESWATYIESCWLEDQKGEDEQRYDLWRHAAAYLSEADDVYARPLVTRRFASSWQMYDAHLYPGGACRLHTLRRELGDDVFWPAVTDYLKTYHDQVVETDDFRRVMEAHSGRSLQKFFDQWFGSSGYPDIKVTFVYDGEKKWGTFEVVQKQAGDGKKAPVFEMSTDLGWTIKGTDHVWPIHLTKARQSFTIPMDSDPDVVRFDPLGKVLHKLEMDPGEARLKTQLKAAKDVVGRILAAQTLARKGKRSGFRAIAEAYASEPFWGVRREMLKALADSHSEEGLRALIQAAGEETHHLVLDRVFSSIAAYRDDAVIKAVSDRLARGDLPPGARAQAYMALAAQKEAAPAKLLLEAAQGDPSVHRQAAAAAWYSLGLSRQGDWAQELRQRARPGAVHYRERRSVVLGLSVLTPYLETRDKVAAEETLMDLLRDDEPWIRMAAAQGLKNAKVQRAAPLLETYAATLSKQESVMVGRWIKALHKSDKAGELVSLEKTVTDLKGKVRQLEDQMEDLRSRVEPTFQQ